MTGLAPGPQKTLNITRRERGLFQFTFFLKASLDRSKWEAILTAQSPPCRQNLEPVRQDHLPDTGGHYQAESINIPTKMGEMYKLLVLVPVLTHLDGNEFWGGFYERNN